MSVAGLRPADLRADGDTDAGKPGKIAHGLIHGHNAARQDPGRSS